MKLLRPNLLLAALGLVALALVASPMRLTAQSDPGTQSDVEPPAGPMLATAPDFSKWVVTFTYAEERAKTPVAGPPRVESRTRKITTTKTNKIIHEETVGAQGDTRDDWHVGLVQYARVPGSTDWFQGSATSTFPPSGFLGLDWITEDHYIGTTKYAGKPCLVFTQQASGPLTSKVAADLMNTLDSLGTLAFVDAESRLPVEVRENSNLRVYQFLPAPTEVQALPPDLADSLKKADAIHERFNRPLQQTY